MHNKKLLLSGAFTTSLLLLGVLFSTTSAYGHGYISPSTSDSYPTNTPAARAAIKANADLGDIQYEPQSVEGPKGFPGAGPADGKIASAGNNLAEHLDQQSATRWIKNNVSPGALTIRWKYTAPHRTTKWHYYITKPDWDQNAPLTRNSLEHIETVMHDGTPSKNDTPHTVNIPADRTGYHVLLGVWDIADTANAFYNVVDLEITGSLQEETTPPPSSKDNTANDGEKSNKGDTFTQDDSSKSDTTRKNNEESKHETENSNKEKLTQQDIPSASPYEEEETPPSLANTGNSLFWPGYLLAFFILFATPALLKLLSSTKLTRPVTRR